MKLRDLSILLKVHHWFGFGPIQIDEQIGSYCVEDKIRDREKIEYFLRRRSSWEMKKITRARRTFLYNLIDNFITRYDIKRNYFGQPFYSHEDSSIQRIIPAERGEVQAVDARIERDDEEREGDGWLDIIWR